MASGFPKLPGFAPTQDLVLPSSYSRSPTTRKWVIPSKNSTGMWYFIRLQSEQCWADLLPATERTAACRAWPESYAQPELHIDNPRSLPSKEWPRWCRAVVPARLGSTRPTRATLLWLLQGERGVIQPRELSNSKGTSTVEIDHPLLLPWGQLAIDQWRETGELRHSSGYLSQTREDYQQEWEVLCATGFPCGWCRGDSRQDH